ncbi:uncharacterized protein LOC128200058 [Galleria mellonella]|uniref:Uncharacterized protein LOC128200058 n=1 Tax=Galleria mellonella TaxID=7137 RepID=A0ABM3M9M2_GALME|nr:uncharacterized protein LOC128200058 [Galleria mellonella]
MGAPYVELDKPLDDFALLCRGCLANSGEMKNMVQWGLAEDFYKFTNIQVSDPEGVSELLCTSCENVLSTCRRFREQCQNSNTLLQNIVKKNNKVEQLEPKGNTTHENTVKCIQCDNKLIIMITAPNTEDKIHLPCPYECPEMFTKKSTLYYHLIKIHSVKKSLIIDLQYYCTVDGCSYASNSEENKYFSGRKYLNQHYNKVHTIKTYCHTCKLSFSTDAEFYRHLNTCNTTFSCELCDVHYNTNAKLLVHLMRRHPELHKQYKDKRKANKRKLDDETDAKKLKIEYDKVTEFMCDSPKRSFATQTLSDNIKNDVALPSWQILGGRGEMYETKTDEISTQTVFEDLLSLKSQTSEDESMFFSETVSLSDIQTQTFPLEFGLSRSNKETITEVQSADLNMKETQTCYCHDSPKTFKLFDSISSSPSSINLTSTETQTAERSLVKSDVLLSFNSAETQTSFDEELGKHNL